MSAARSATSASSSTLVNVSFSGSGSSAGSSPRTPFANSFFLAGHGLQGRSGSYALSLYVGNVSRGGKKLPFNLEQLWHRITWLSFGMSAAWRSACERGTPIMISAAAT